MGIKLEIDSDLKFEPPDYKESLRKSVLLPFNVEDLETKLGLELYPSIPDLAKLCEIAYSSRDDIIQLLKGIW